jgi:nitroimidazol reductase NimA-like FMN-containing flavoprotein (pyridoxamine 5'-phosphate oxidase superfamily)
MTSGREYYNHLYGAAAARLKSVDSETSIALAKLIRKERIAHLATLRGGAPMVSMTLYRPEADFSAFYVHVSRLAWHTQDMLQDPRVALSIAETDDARPDPFTLMRVSIRGQAVELPNGGPSFEHLKGAWLERFPEQEINFELADFSFWRIAPRDARFVAGFGRIHNLSAEQLKNAGA